MTFIVTVSGADIAFPCEPGETVLDAVERAGYSVPYSCRKGVCTTCVCHLASGDAKTNSRPLSGPADDVLLCRLRPLSDITIAPTSITHRGTPQRKSLPAKVFRLSRPTPDVAIVELRYPIGTRAQFRAGQYLKVLMPDGDSRNYSLANDPTSNNGAELHIRHVPGGRFSEDVLARLKPGDELTVELPFGQFVMRESTDTPAILLATGTGFGPLKSMILDQIRRRTSRPMWLYWGARRQQDLYALELTQKWAARFPWLSMVPVVSGEHSWTGRTGWVQQAAIEDHGHRDALEVYACGNPAMTAAAAAAFAALGHFVNDNFHCDAFVPSGDAAGLA